MADIWWSQWVQRRGTDCGPQLPRHHGRSGNYKAKSLWPSQVGPGEEPTLRPELQLTIRARPGYVHHVRWESHGKNGGRHDRKSTTAQCYPWNYPKRTSDGPLLHLSNEDHPGTGQLRNSRKRDPQRQHVRNARQSKGKNVHLIRKSLQSCIKPNKTKLQTV